MRIRRAALGFLALCAFATACGGVDPRDDRLGRTNNLAGPGTGISLCLDSAGSPYFNCDMDQLRYGDFNGDGVDDRLCFSPNMSGARALVQIDYGRDCNPSNPYAGHVDYSAYISFCSSGKLQVGDFNGDGKDDLLCHDVGSGSFSIDYAFSSGASATSNQFAGVNHQGSLCRDAWLSKRELRVGDFNGDGRSDLLCWERNFGFYDLHLASSAGHFSGTPTWSRSDTNAGFCDHTAVALVGDFNGDGRDDLACYFSAPAESNLNVDYASSSGRFTGRNAINWLESYWCRYGVLRAGKFGRSGNRAGLVCASRTWVNGDARTQLEFRLSGSNSRVVMPVYSMDVFVANTDGTGYDDVVVDWFIHRR